MSESDDIQEEMGFEAQSPPPSDLKEVEISKTGWTLKMLRHEDDKVVVKISCKSKERDWYSLIVRIPKNKLKLI